MTDAISVQLNGTDNKTVALDGLYNDDSKTAIRKQLTVELTANPEWYAVQALPMIAEADNDDALSWATVFMPILCLMRFSIPMLIIRRLFPVYVNCSYLMDHGAGIKVCEEMIMLPTK